MSNLVDYQNYLKDITVQVVYRMSSVDGVNFKLKFLDYPYISATVHFEENENSIDKAIQAVSRQWLNEYNQTVLS